MQALFVDLPNFYSHFLESKIEEPRLLRDYFLEWFDFDRLAYELTGEHSPVWVFHSNRRFGPRQNRIENREGSPFLTNFINRINSQKGVTARNVNIPGDQREPASYECENCGNTGIAQWESEKGIDASLTVHLFDTVESWDDAYLLSGDADFVPVVQSLRRRGKIVIGAGFSNASSALIRECYDYIDLTSFLREDFATYIIFKQDGIFQKWLLDHVNAPSENPNKHQPIRLTAEWQFDSGYTHGFSGTLVKTSEEKYVIWLAARGPIDLSTRHQLITDFQQKFTDNVLDINSPQGTYRLALNAPKWEGVKRRFELFKTPLNQLREYEAHQDGIGFEIQYEYDTGKDVYKVTK